MLVASGEYTGNGTDDRTITVGFEPVFVVVAGRNSARSVMRFGTMPTNACNNTALDASTFFGGGIKTFVSNGFTVGTANYVNTTSVEYVWFAIGDNGAGDVAYGSYTGNGSDPRNITGVGFNPEVVMLLQENAADFSPYSGAARGFRSSDTGKAINFAGFGSTTSDFISALISDGFTVKENNLGNFSANTDTYTYHWIAFAGDQLHTFTYTGNGSDDRSVTAATIGAIIAAFVIKIGGSGSGSVGTQQYFESMDTNETSSYTEENINLTDRIQDISGQSIVVGTNNAVNLSGGNYVGFSFSYIFAVSPLTLNIDVVAVTLSSANTLDIDPVSLTISILPVTLTLAELKPAPIELSIDVVPVTLRQTYNIIPTSAGERWSYGDTEPVNPAQGDIWVQSDEDPVVLSQRLNFTWQDLTEVYSEAKTLEAISDGGSSSSGVAVELLELTGLGIASDRTIIIEAHLYKSAHVSNVTGIELRLNDTPVFTGMSIGDLLSGNDEYGYWLTVIPPRDRTLDLGGYSMISGNTVPTELTDVPQATPIDSIQFWADPNGSTLELRNVRVWSLTSR